MPTLAQLVTPSGEEPLDDTWLRARIDASARTIVDVGTGDGRYALALAREFPDALVVGIDPAADNLRATAARAARRRDGAANLVLVRAGVEKPPHSLLNAGQEVDVILPWGRLLEGLLVPDPAVTHGLVVMTHPGGTLRVVLNAGAWDSAPARLAALARPDEDFVHETIAPAMEDAGFRIDEVRTLDSEEARTIPSTWAGRLAHRGRTPSFVLLRATRS